MTSITPLHLLKVMSERKTYERYNKYISYEILPKETEVLLKDYGRYFKHPQFIDHKHIDFSRFLVEFQTNWHATGISEDQHRGYIILLENVEKTPLLDSEACLTPFIAKEARLKIEQFWENDFDPEKIKVMLDRYEKKLSEIVKDVDNERFDIRNVELGSLDRRNGIPWALQGLNNSLGNMIKGDFAIFGAGVNAGKSAFVISQVATTLKYIKNDPDAGPILFFNSEGSLDVMWARVLSALSSKSTEFIVENRKKALLGFSKTYGEDAFWSYELAGHSVGFIENKIKKYKPSLVIIDMIDAVTAGKSDNEVTKSKDLYQKLRSLSGEYCPIIGTCQVKDSAAFYWNKEESRKVPKKWLGLSDLHFSNVEKQGAASIVIMVGMDENYPDERYINIVKEKGGRAAKFACYINKEFNRYEDI